MRAFRSFAAAAALLFAAGCSDSTAPRTDHLGAYVLVSVDGEDLPVTLVDDGVNTLTVSAGDLVLGPGNRATTSITFELVSGQEPPLIDSIVCAGTHRRSGNTITLTLPDTENCAGGSFSGTLSGGTITVSDRSGSTLVYARQP